MKIDFERKRGIIIGHIEGELLKGNAAVLEQKLGELLRDGNLHIVLDMALCKAIGSLCLAAIVEFKKKASEKGGSIKLTHVNTAITDILRVTGLIKHVEISGEGLPAQRPFALRRTG